MHQDNVSLTVGLNANGELVSVRNPNVPSGAKCGLVCPECAARLIARKGSVLTHHFAHPPTSECKASNESTLHKFAKEVFARQRHMHIAVARMSGSSYSDVLPNEFSYSYERQVCLDNKMIFDDAKVEHRVYAPNGEYIIADVAYFFGDDEVLLLEVNCTHEVDKRKMEKARRIGIPMVEVSMPPIDISLEDMVESGQDWHPVVERWVLRGQRKWIINTPQYLLAMQEIQDHISAELIDAEVEFEAAQENARKEKRKEEEERSLISGKNSEIIDKAKDALRDIMCSSPTTLAVCLIEISKRVSGVGVDLIHRQGKSSKLSFDAWRVNTDQDKWVVKFTGVDWRSVESCRKLLKNSAAKFQHNELNAIIPTEELMELWLNTPHEFQVEKIKPGSLMESTSHHIQGLKKIDAEEYLPPWMHGEERELFAQLFSRGFDVKSIPYRGEAMISMAIPVNGLIDLETKKRETRVVCGVMSFSWGLRGEVLEKEYVSFEVSSCGKEFSDEFVGPAALIGGVCFPISHSLRSLAIDDAILRYGIKHAELNTAPAVIEDTVLATYPRKSFRR